MPLLDKHKEINGQGFVPTAVFKSLKHLLAILKYLSI